MNYFFFFSLILVLMVCFSFLLCTVPFLRYGEGWDFGEVAKNGRGVNASQFNLSGTQIGR